MFGRQGRWTTRGACRRLFVCAIAAASLGAGLAAPAGAAEHAATTASFTWAPAAPVSGQAVTFSSTSTAASGRSIRFYAWDVEGDGRFDDSTTSSTTRTFAGPGSYTVRLVAVDDHGGWSVATHTVTVRNAPPVADFDFSPAAPVAGQPVTFSASSGDVDGQVTSEAWDFSGDGRFADASGLTAGHVFDDAGVHVVALRVTDDRGASTVVQRSVTVAPAATSSPVPPPPSSTVAGDGDQPHAASVGFDTGSPATAVPTAPGLARLVPFPVVRVRGSAGRLGTRVTLFTVSAPSGARIAIRCRGRSCGRRQIARVARGASSPLLVHIRALERVLRPGTRIEVRVTEAGLVGKYTRLVIRRLAAPRRLDSCLMPGSSRPAACPVGS